MNDSKFLLKEYIRDALNEGRGVVARHEGEEYTNASGDKLSFLQAIVFPPKTSAYSSHEELNQKLSAALDVPEIVPGATSKKNKFRLEKIANKPNASSKAAIVVILTSEKGEKIGFLRYFSSMNSNGYGRWPEVEFTKDTGFSRQKSTSVLETLPLKVTDLVADFNSRNVAQLKDTVLSNAKKLVSTKAVPEIFLVHLEQLFSAAMSNSPAPILKGAKKYKTVYEKYIGELFAPISLVTGWLSQGQREEAEKILVKGKGKASFANMTIRFPQSTINMLTDSEVIFGKEKSPAIKVGISSKAAGGGAAASLTGLYRTIQEANFPDSVQKKYGSVFQLIKLIFESNSVEGPLEVARLLGIISAVDKKYVLSLFKGTMAISSLPEFKTLIRNGKLAAPSRKLLQISEAFGGVNPLTIKTALPNYRPAYHFLAAIAKQLGVQINKSQVFDEGVRTVLNRSSMVQIYLKVKNAGAEDIVFESFFVKYPPNFDGKIILDSSKSYYASGPPKGKIGFKLT